MAENNNNRRGNQGQPQGQKSDRDKMGQQQGGQKQQQGNRGNQGLQGDEGKDPSIDADQDEDKDEEADRITQRNPSQRDGDTQK